MMKHIDDVKDELTRWPWRWAWNGTAGNFYLYGDGGQGPITHSGPHRADGKAKEAAPEMLQQLKEIRAWLEVAPEFKDWPAARSYLKDVRKTIELAENGRGEYFEEGE